MTARSDADRAARPSKLKIARRRRRLIPRGNGTLTLLVALTVVATVVVLIWPTNAPMTVLIVPLLLGSLLLGPRQLPWFVVMSLAFVALGVPRQSDLSARLMVSYALVFVVGFIFLVVI